MALRVDHQGREHSDACFFIANALRPSLPQLLLDVVGILTESVAGAFVSAR
jgi:hypothetical protein